MMLIPLITVTVVAGTILVCYVLYICRKKIQSVYNNNKIITIKIKKIKNSNSTSNSNKSNDSESDWEDHCSAMEQNNEDDNDNDDDAGNSTKFDDDSFAGSLMWDNESNIIAPSTEHIYDSVAGSMLLINNEKDIYQNTTTITNETEITATLNDNPIYQGCQHTTSYSSNPFINNNRTHFTSNPFIAEKTNFSETNPFRRAHSEDYLNNKQDHDNDLESSIASLV
ncbi:iev transmembrane phosphoprotein [Raccoonpox virus]|uniref:IEV transmembrane phosphoprotein n=1 Tax=Raccoon poxvirus TaxID=10256 RepID=A0A0G3G4J7_RACVI|nr:IEV transmembrane phosphoprotein [Raccoonpox virus]AKJ93786.1 IEV transmembrane phosphoprotein [Raccoonpox virus]AOP31418.1 iev transmembrane phosphoprotein [Raccoonpox virus]